MRKEGEMAKFISIIVTANLHKGYQKIVGDAKACFRSTHKAIAKKVNKTPAKQDNVELIVIASPEKEILVN